MFDFDSLREIYATVSKNKLRTSLTGFAVAWGIFMLILLLGSGNGLKNGVTSNFKNRAKNTISLYPGWTSEPYHGMPTGRQIKFDYRDFELIKNKIPAVQYVSAGLSQSVTLSYNQEYGAWNLQGVSQDAAYINNIIILKGNGRFINQIDVDKRRKVIIITADMQKILFKNTNPIGKYVSANNIAYRVVGIYDNANQYNTNPPAFIPFTTAQMLYNKGFGFQNLDFTVLGLNSKKANDKFIELIRHKMGALHTFKPSDQAALYVWNTAEDSVQTAQIFNGITIFIWIIGFACLIAGIVGVGNIMLVTVKERTREIGIRKAIGASPASVVKLIIIESVIITAVSGYIGLIIGIGLTEGVSKIIENQAKTGGPTIFKNPTVDLTTVFAATLILIIAGVVSGLIPAVKAAKVRPIEAMRAE